MKAHHMKSKDTLAMHKANSLSGRGPCNRSTLYHVHFEVKAPTSRTVKVNLNLGKKNACHRTSGVIVKGQSPKSRVFCKVPILA